MKHDGMMELAKKKPDSPIACILPHRHCNKYLGGHMAVVHVILLCHWKILKKGLGSSLLSHICQTLNAQGSTVRTLMLAYGCTITNQNQKGQANPVL